METARLPEGMSSEALLELFLRSSGAKLDSILDSASRLESGWNEEALEEMLRLAHNLKGAALQFGFEEVAQAATLLERFCRGLIQQPQRRNSLQVTRIFQVVRYLRELLHAAAANAVPQVDEVLLRDLEAEAA